MSSLTWAPTLALVIFGLGGVIVASNIAARLGRFLNFRTMLILNYVLVQFVSGIAHLAQVDDASRGFFDLLSPAEPDTLAFATVASIVGLIVLCIACLQRMPEEKPEPIAFTNDYWLIRRERRFVLLTVAVTLPLALSSTQFVVQYAQTLDVTRIISLTGGVARYSYISNWLVWAISLLAILMLSRSQKNRLFVLLVTVAATFGIALSLTWTGGRSIIVVMALPLLLVLLPLLKGIRGLVLFTGASAALVYIYSVTQLRIGGGEFNAATWLDWEWGRFSMAGWAHTHIEANGHLLGETFASGLLNVILGALRLLGIPVNNPDMRISTQVTGEAILGSSEAIYIVPGLVAELAINFGLLGVGIGFYILGRFANWVDAKFAQSPSVVSRLVFAYLGTLLVFRTVAADSGSIYSYLLYSGAPLLLVAIQSKWARTRAAKTPPPSAPPPRPVLRTR